MNLAAAPRSLELIRVDDLTGFDALRSAWDDLRRADPYASVFLSSAWLRAFLAVSPLPWSILALRDGGRLAGALPISLRGSPHPKLPVARQLTFASAPFADYQGMLCRPDDEAEVVDRFAAALSATPWDIASFTDVLDPRFAAIVERLRDGGATLREFETTPCSAIDLPADWESLLARLSKPTRRSTLRPMKMIAEGIPNWRATGATAADADAHIEAILDLNALRWGTTADRNEKYRRLFRATFAANCLRINVLWDGDHAFAASASFIDPERGVYADYLLGHDPAYGRFSPGKAILATCIQEAIDGGFRTFDFMRGGEAYKGSYATGETHNRHFAMARGSARARLLRLVQPLYDAVRAASVRIRTRRPAA
jgi:CelD/BcsL family acetyltransferase involved in cellulose biosynthesis